MIDFLNYNGEWRISGKPCPTFPLMHQTPEKVLPQIVAEEGYKEYAAQYGTQQSLNRIGERGGFSPSELAILLFHRIQRLGDAVNFLKSACDKGRIVPSGDLTPLQIAEAQRKHRFYVDDETGLGWAIVPWDLTTHKDLERGEG